MTKIEWIKDGSADAYTALIGEYEYDGQMQHVYGLIYFGFPLRYGWDVRVQKIQHPRNGGGGIIHQGTPTNDLEQAKRDAEAIGKQWIESDS